jgi:hypothetical protein
MLKNSREGPRVETLLRAVDALGLSLSEFFGSMERGEEAAGRARSNHRLSAHDQRALAIGRAILAEIQALQSQPRHRRR